jgi:hypothetical protein
MMPNDIENGVVGVYAIICDNHPPPKLEGECFPTLQANLFVSLLLTSWHFGEELSKALLLKLYC